MPSSALRVLSLASECYPYVKTGGLADVVGALPAPLAAQGIEVTTLIPSYRGVMPHEDSGVIAVDLPAFFDRDGSPYLDAQGRDWPDNLQRFNAFARRGAELALGLSDLPRFNVVHAHDWQAAAVIPHLEQLANVHGLKRPATVFTIHNLAFQGRFALPPAGSKARADLGLFDIYFGSEWLEFWNDVNLLKAAVLQADAVTTVSPTYASEITTQAFGEHLDEVLRYRRSALHGVLNGLNTEVWHPASDPLIAQPYDLKSHGKGKAANKAALQTQFVLDDTARAPLFGLVTRLSNQKGIDLILANIDRVISAGGQFAILGSGDPAMEAALRAKAEANPTSVAVQIGYDEALAHQIHAASDYILVPSRFEPCGLTQLSGQVYGAVPIVSPVGGLRDTVIHANPAALSSGRATGLIMRDVSAQALGESLDEALALYADRKAYGGVRRRGMGMIEKFGWDEPAARYAALYRDLVAKQT